MSDTKRDSYKRVADMLTWQEQTGESLTAAVRECPVSAADIRAVLEDARRYQAASRQDEDGVAFLRNLAATNRRHATNGQSIMGRECAATQAPILDRIADELEALREAANAP